MNRNPKKIERVIIVGLELENDENPIERSLDELEELVIAAGASVEARISQKANTINPTYYIGRGKAEEIKAYSLELNIDTIVFNNELSGAQLRNLEKIIDKKIVDRTNLILDIFANRANSKEGKLQVKLAQLEYRLPRLVGFRDYLSREGGGIGTRGPGEQKLETDRRHILREINNIKKDLALVAKNRKLKRQKRHNSNLPIVALVGYTNAGKSTLLNSIINLNEYPEKSKEVFVKDMLFATLDTSLRKARLPNGQSFLLTDTVGFVSKLPTKLVEAFKGTLEELSYADLLLHVVDASNEDLDIQLKTTYKLLEDLDILNKPIITVFNKMDKIKIEDLYYEDYDLKNKIFISSRRSQDVRLLLKEIQDKLPQKFRRVTLKIPYSDQQLVDYFMTNYKVDNIKYHEDGTSLELLINQIDFNKYFKYII